MMDEVYVIDAARTPRGKGRAGGALSSVRPIALMRALYHALGARGVPLDEVDQVLLGCVTQTHEQGGNLAKISALFAGLPDRTSGMTLNSFCASGLDAVVQGAARIHAGLDELVIAGGVESMSRAPLFSDRGPWFSDPEVAKITGFVQMGFAADLVASLAGLEREALDAYAARSHARASHAHKQGHFARSLVPIYNAAGERLLDHDELVRDTLSLDWLAAQQPLFADEAASALARKRYPQLDAVIPLHHQGNAPQLADGAALVALASGQRADALGLRKRARVRAAASASVEPVAMLTAAADATRRAVARAGLRLEDVDLFEINEAFAGVIVKLERDLELDPDRLNVDGGVIAAGHAMGASGAILLTTLLDALERHDRSVGVVAISGGAGLGSALVLERV